VAALMHGLLRSHLRWAQVALAAELRVDIADIGGDSASRQLR